jgi:UDP-sugar diphosphatase
MLKPVEILSIEENDKPKFVKTQFVKAKREDREFGWEMIKSHDSVHVIVYNTTTREFILVEQVRVPVLVNNPDTNGAVYEACAGLVDKEHTIAQIAKEEILEELGYDVPLEKIKFIKTLKSAVGTAGTNAHTFYAEVTESEKVSNGGGLDSEDIAVVRVHIDVIQDWLYNETTITDAVTMFLVNYYYSMLIDE